MEKKLVPPDGGWGWIIVFAYALNNIIVIPMMQGFGLIFQETFSNLGMSATDASVIINVNSAFGMALGLINGPLLRRFGYRKVSFVGGSLITVGITMTAFANSFAHFLITYSIITSLGFGLVTSSFSLALNTYFRERRSRAAGLAMTITGLGPIFFPHIISFLLKTYGVTGCVLILGALAAHSVVAALLLQPIKWHMKEIIVETNALADIEEADEENEDAAIQPVEKFTGSKGSMNFNNKNDGRKFDSLWEIYSSEDEDDYLERPRRRIRPRLASIDHDVDSQSIYGFENTSQPKRGSDLALAKTGPPKLARLSRLQLNRSISTPYEGSSTFPMKRPHRWFESGSLETINLGSSVKIFDEKAYAPVPEEDEDSEKHAHRKTKVVPKSAEVIAEHEANIMLKIAAAENANKQNGKLHALELPGKPDAKNESAIIIVKKKNKYKRSAVRCIKFFDLDLLKDPIYVSLMLGMSIAIFAEINFSLLTPFILHDLNFTTDQIASIMSSLAITDIISRFCSPYIGEFLKQKPRLMYMYSLGMLIITRTSLLFADSYTKMLMVGLGLGVAKGIRTVYMSLVIPSYISIERLASASGIQMVTNGIILLIFGPLLGVIRDVTGSYTRCIIFINAVTMITILMWSFEIMYTRNQEKKKEKPKKIIMLC